MSTAQIAQRLRMRHALLLRSNPNHAPGGSSEGGQFTSGGGGSGSKSAADHLKAINDTATAANDAAKNGTYTQAHTDAFNSALSALAADKSIKSAELKTIASQFVHGTGSRHG